MTDRSPGSHGDNHHDHGHQEGGLGSASAERRTLWVVAISAVTMLVEILTGWLTGSMALLADGWHMATHVAALSVTVLAYRLARHQAQSPRWTFGSWKFEILGSFTSAVALALAGLAMVLACFERLLKPVSLQADDAIVVAVMGLLINLGCAYFLHQPSGACGHAHGDDHHVHGHGRDLNLYAAYLHLLSDALTSVAAIAALLIASWTGQTWPDPVVGLLGSLLILRWAKGLMFSTGAILMDEQAPQAQRQQIQGQLEHVAASLGCCVQNLSVWRTGQQRYSAVVRLRGGRQAQQAPADVTSACRASLAELAWLDVIAVELVDRSRGSSGADDECDPAAVGGDGCDVPANAPAVRSSAEA